MRGASRSAMWFAFVGACVVAPAPATAEEEPSCRPYLIYCNYADHFSGTIHWKSVLKVEGDPASGSSEDITVTVAGGKATCAGTMNGKAIRGPGLFAVERGASMEDAPGQRWYAISASCPDEDGKTANIDNALIKTYKQKDDSGLKTLTGKLEEEHPDADSLNGVSGTTLLEWSLSRSGPALR